MNIYDSWIFMVPKKPLGQKKPPFNGSAKAPCQHRSWDTSRQAPDTVRPAPPTTAASLTRSFLASGTKNERHNKAEVKNSNKAGKFIEWHVHESVGRFWELNPIQTEPLWNIFLYSTQAVFVVKWSRWDWTCYKIYTSKAQVQIQICPKMEHLPFRNFHWSGKLVHQVSMDGLRFIWQGRVQSLASELRKSLKAIHFESVGWKPWVKIIAWKVARFFVIYHIYIYIW